MSEPESIADVRKRSWKTRREKYGERGHGGSYCHPQPIYTARWNERLRSIAQRQFNREVHHGAHERREGGERMTRIPTEAELRAALSAFWDAVNRERAHARNRH